MRVFVTAPLFVHSKYVIVEDDKASFDLHTLAIRAEWWSVIRGQTAVFYILVSSGGTVEHPFEVLQMSSCQVIRSGDCNLRVHFHEFSVSLLRISCNGDWNLGVPLSRNVRNCCFLGGCCSIGGPHLSQVGCVDLTLRCLVPIHLI